LFTSNSCKSFLSPLRSMPVDISDIFRLIRDSARGLCDLLQHQAPLWFRQMTSCGVVTADLTIAPLHDDATSALSGPRFPQGNMGTCSADSLGHQG
jgi:hypothetical protein